jgi:hypothetical protein
MRKSVFGQFFSAIATTAVAFSLIQVTANAAPRLQQFRQPEQRDQYGRRTVEASVITVVSCNGAGENGNQYYIYQYVNRARAILPPYWNRAIGGHDWASYEQAVGEACGTGGGGNAPMNLTGSWRLTTSCGFTNPAWSATINLSQVPGGALTATSSNDPLNVEWVGPDPAPGSWGSKMKSQVNGSLFNLLLHPRGWVSVLEFTGTVSGSRIDGRIHHYTTDDCSFTMVRQ